VLSAEIVQNLLLGILALLIPATAAYLKLKLKGQNDLDMLKAKNEAKRTEAIQESTAVLKAHTETLREVVRVLGDGNTSNQVLVSIIKQVVEGHQSLVQDMSSMSKLLIDDKTAIDKYIVEVERGMREIHSRIDSALLERRSINRE